MQAKIQKLNCVTHEGSYLALALDGTDVPIAPHCVRQILRVPSAMYPKTADHQEDHVAMEVMFGKICNMVNAYAGLKHAAEELDKTHEWLTTGKVDGVPCTQQELADSVARVLAKLLI